MKKKLYVFRNPETDPVRRYDYTLAAVCAQGIFNRSHPTDRMYFLTDDRAPSFWLDVFSSEDGWLSEYEKVTVDTFDEIYSLAVPYIKKTVIWDPSVPATVNIACTDAGINDGIVVSPELYSEKASLLTSDIIDLRGRYDGSVTGSAKNDAYRDAIEKYMKPGLCSKHWLCLYEDAAYARQNGDIGYVITRDWAIYNRAFVYDLSPWGDEVPKDDPNQKIGCDLETYHLLLSEQLRQTDGKQMTEVAGFFCFGKYSNVSGNISKHEPVPTEWETVYLISPYNCYQNTVASSCCNQSLHSQHKPRELKQGRPGDPGKPENKCYICIHMADYDSMTPLYCFMPDKWIDSERGKLPLGWGINPNLVETYPDIFEYLYSTRTENDWFAADASAAGYFNPNRILPEHWNMVAEHNRKFYEMTDMSASPMVLDWEAPTEMTEKYFARFSPDGFSTIVMDMHGNGGHAPDAHITDGMPICEMYNGACNWAGTEKTASFFTPELAGDTPDKPCFHMIRMVWITPSQVRSCIDEVKRLRPDLDIELVNPYNYFNLLKQHLSKQERKTDE